MTLTPPVKLIRPRPEPACAHYRFGLRKDAAGVPVDLHRGLPAALASLPGQIDEVLSDHGFFGRVSAVSPDDESGRNFSLSVILVAIRFAGSPAQKIEQIIDHVTSVLIKISAGLEIEGNVIPLASNRELSFTEAINPSGYMDKVRIIFYFDQFVMR